MLGINKVILSGNVSSEIYKNKLHDGTDAVSFTMISDRRSGGKIIAARVKINVYLEQLVVLCDQKLTCGGYVIVEGELMNRSGHYGKLTEVRAQEIVFLKEGRR